MSLVPAPTQRTCSLSGGRSVFSQKSAPPRASSARAETQSPKANVVALSRAVIDCLLEADVLAAAVKIEGAERGGGIGRIQQERPDHAPRAGHVQPVGDRPAGGRKGALQLLHRSDQHDIDGVAWQPVAGDGEPRHALALEDLKAHPDRARQDEIRRNSISERQSQNCRQPAVGQSEDEDDQPYAKDAQRHDEQTPQQADQHSHDRVTIRPAIRIASILRRTTPPAWTIGFTVVRHVTLFQARTVVSGCDIVKLRMACPTGGIGETA